MLRDVLPLVGVLIGGLITGGFQVLVQARGSKGARRERDFDELAVQAKRITVNASLLVAILSVRRGLLGAVPVRDEEKSKLWLEEYEYITTFWSNVRAWNILAGEKLIERATALSGAVSDMLTPTMSDDEFRATATDVTEALESFELEWLAYRRVHAPHSLRSHT